MKYKPTRFMAEDSGYDEKLRIMPYRLFNAFRIQKEPGRERNLSYWTGRNR